ncbi:MAG TPA: SPOR domain-containing protein [bacterium]|nr:SPOR domain-containing protein [bacterium]
MLTIRIRERDTGNAELQRVAEFARQSGLDVIEISPARRSVAVWGTAALTAAAFRVKLGYYGYAGQVCRGHIGPVYLPPGIAHIVEAVAGLDNGAPSETDAAATPIVNLPRVRVRLAVVPVLVFIAGAVVSGLLFRSTFAARSTSSNSLTQGVAAEHAASSRDSQPGAIEIMAWRSFNAGRLANAQDGFLQVLAMDPTRHSSLRGLVAVRRKVAVEEPLTMRQQVAAYRAALRRGSAGVGRYSRAALEILISASLTAIKELDSAQTPAVAASRPPAPLSEPPQSAGSRHPTGENAHAEIGPPAARRPAPAVAKLPQSVTPDNAATPSARRAVPRPSLPLSSPQGSSLQGRPGGRTVPASSPGLSPPPDPTAATTPAPTSASAQAPQAGSQTTPSHLLYVVRIGPVADRDRAAAVAKQLSAEGFSQADITTQNAYRVVSEPLPRKVAEDMRSALASRGVRSYALPLGADTVQLLFGIAGSQKDAEALAARVTGMGYDAWVREAPVYQLRLGPYPQPSVDTIAGIVKAGAPEAGIATDPSSAP